MGLVISKIIFKENDQIILNIRFYGSINTKYSYLLIKYLFFTF